MSVRLDPGLLVRDAAIVSPPAPRACDDPRFELPGRLYAAMATLFFGFMAVMTVGFGNPGLVVPMAINVAFLTAFFAVPVLFVRTGHGRGRSLSWKSFREEGVETATGRTASAEATILVLLLPAVIFVWGLAVVAIAATA